MCDRGCFSQMGDVLFASLRVSKLQKLEKGSILRVYNGVHLMMEVAPPPLNKSLTSMLFTVNEIRSQGVAKGHVSYGGTHLRYKQLYT